MGLEVLWERHRRVPMLALSAAAVFIIALVDWLTKAYISLGFLYLFPLMLAAGFLARWQILLAGVVCAILAEAFSSLPISYVRLGFESLALAGCGLFAGELLRNRRLTLESDQKLTALVETSPAAILTVNDKGFIELANRAASEMLLPRNGVLAGSPIAAFLPELHYALRWEDAPQFRASMQCHAHRGNGETFLADVWFSTYREGQSPKLAAILAEVPGAADEPNLATPGPSERPSLTNRELDVLRYLVQGLANKEIATRMELSESSVKNTLQQLFSKLGVRTRAQVVRVALERYRDLL